MKLLNIIFNVIWFGNETYEEVLEDKIVKLSMLSELEKAFKEQRKVNKA